MQVRTTYYWVQGFLIASLVAWFGMRGFISETSNPKWNETAQDYLEPGVRHFRGEEGKGWVDFSNDGILGAEEGLSETERHVVFWGDSFIEAYQVEPRQTCYAKFSVFAEQSSQFDLKAIAVAKSGRDLAHHLELMGRYDELIPNREINIVLFDYQDVLPNGTSLVINGEPVWKYVVPKPSMLSVRQFVDDYQLDVFWLLLKRGIDSAKNLRLMPGPVEVESANEKAKESSYTQKQLEAFWDQLAKALAENEKRYGRIVMMFHPRVPRLVDGQTKVTVSDHQSIQKFMAICEKHGIETVDLTNPFLDFHQRTGQFIHGFSNSFPSRGHWNANGHQVVAKAAWEFYQANPMNVSTKD